MKKPVKELDLDFDNTFVDLYVVVDTTTNLEVSPVMNIRNDAMAVDAFKHFIEEQKDKKPAYSKYELINLGTYNVNLHCMCSGDKYIVVTEDEDLEAYYKEIVEAIGKKENEED